MALEIACNIRPKAIRATDELRLISCEVCLRVFDFTNPARTLMCGHHFCTMCLQESDVFEEAPPNLSQDTEWRVSCLREACLQGTLMQTCDVATSVPINHGIMSAVAMFSSAGATPYVVRVKNMARCLSLHRGRPLPSSTGI